MLKKFLRNIVLNFFRKGLLLHEEELRQKRNQDLSKSCIMGQNTLIDNLAQIQNHTGSKEKIVIGSNSWIRGDLLIFNHGGSISIGDDCFVGPDSKIWSASSIKIGDRVLISHNVNIHDNNSHPIDPQKRHEDFLFIRNNHTLQFENSLNEKPIVIGNDVWIGFNSTILKGVTIGDKSIIGANSLVTKDIPPNVIAVGSPAEIIKQLDS